MVKYDKQHTVDPTRRRRKERERKKKKLDLKMSAVYNKHAGPQTTQGYTVYTAWRPCGDTIHTGTVRVIDDLVFTDLARRKTTCPTLSLHTLKCKLPL